MRKEQIARVRGLKFLPSHWHFDHIGDMSKFPPSVNIVVGPGFKENLLPGYPSNPESALLESDYTCVSAPLARSRSI